MVQIRGEARAINWEKKDFFLTEFQKIKTFQPWQLIKKLLKKCEQSMTSTPTMLLKSFFDFAPSKWITLLKFRCMSTRTHNVSEQSSRMMEWSECWRNTWRMRNEAHSNVFCSMQQVKFRACQQQNNVASCSSCARSQSQ